MNRKQIKIFFALSSLVFLGVLYGNDRLITHVTLDNSRFKTTFHIENKAEHESVFALIPFGSEGNILPGTLLAVPAKGVRKLEKDEVFGDLDVRFVKVGISSFPSDDVSVSVSYELTNGDGSAVFFREQADPAKKWRFYSGDWSKVFDAIALVNLSASPTRVSARVIEPDGSTSQERVLVEGLLANQKFMTVVGSDLVSLFQIQPGALIEIESEADVAFLSLQGDLSGKYLWSNASWISQ